MGSVAQRMRNQEAMDPTHSSFLAQLRADLQGPLPGRPAQNRMAPRPRPGDIIPEQAGAHVRRGGVLLLLYPREGQIYLPLILRQTYDGVHSGQVGLPGGGYEEADGDLTQTALREAHEEIGVPPEEVEVLGRLSPLYIHASNFLVQPTVGWIGYRPAFHIDPYEVARLLEVPLLTFLDPSRLRQEEWQLRDRVALVPFFDIEGQTVWGATAMILGEFLALPAVQALKQAVN
ncbi:MAG: coenzyme A pyrophosphatase [Litorilinea sp.]|nr:MAG: coenzyme A pyrophosphatase [Litorilinea sp.]